MKTLIVCMAFAGLAACGGPDDATVEGGARPIAWADVEHAGPRLRGRLPGTVRAVQRARLSFEVAGRVESVAVDVGDRFDEGDTLATLDARSYELRVQRSEAGLAEARAVLAERQNDVARREALAAEQYVSEAALDEARAALKTARSRVGTAQASRALAEENVSETRLRAPYAGEVSARLVEPSQQVAPGTPVLEVQGHDDALEVLVMIPETLIDAVRRGTRHPVTFPARPSLELAGTVSQVGSDTGEANTYPVILTLDGSGDLPSPGMTAEVALHGGAPGSTGLVSIPVTAFRAGKEQHDIAFVYEAKAGVVRRRAITVASIEGDRALVSSGLRAGERIATRGLAFLKDGQAVTLLGTGAARSEQRAIESQR